MRRSFIIAASFLLAFTALASSAKADALEDDLSGLSDEQLKNTVEFAFNNSLFFMFHEAGHMLISEFDLPVLGREEDAADSLSSLLLLEMDNETFDQALVDSVDGWTFSAEAGQEPDLFDSHALNQQRAFSMVCLMVGKDGETFQESAVDLDFPKGRREQCVGEYQKARKSWFGVLEPHIRGEDGQSSFEISYLKPENTELVSYAETFKESNILDILKDVLVTYNLDDDIKLTARECGQSNAYWSPGDREITYCYELWREYTQFMANYYRQEEAE
jgi:Putative metallopeptidase